MGIKLNVNSVEREEKYGIVDDDNISEPSHRYHREIEEVYIPDNEAEMLKKVYSRTVVQDFEDIFHYSEEERNRFKSEHEKLYLLRGRRIKCPKLSEYVKTYRLCLDVIEEFANNNNLIQSEDFLERVLRGKIHIHGLKFPKCVKRGNKKFNWEIIVSYITDRSKDPEELDALFEEASDIVIETDAEDIPIPEAIVDIVEKCGEEDEDNVDYIDQPSLFLRESKKSDKKALRKLFPELDKAINNQFKKERSKNMAHYSRNTLYNDDMDAIRRYDMKHGYKKRMPKFKGDFLNDKDVERYLEKLDDYIEDNTMIQFNGKIYTPEEYDTLRLKQVLEESGWDLRKCFVDKDAERRKRKQAKKDKKKEEKIKKLLSDIQKRKEDRDQKLKGLPQGINVEKYEKQMKKRSKKKKDNKSKKGRKKYERMMLNATTSKRYKNLKRYKKEMEEMKWG